MPNKTIYIPENDLELFSQAQELSGADISPTIVIALRQYVTGLRSKASGFVEVTREVGKNPPYAVKNFYGKLIFETVHAFSSKKHPAQFEISIYETPKQNYVLYINTKVGSKDKAEDGSIVYTDEHKGLSVFETLQQLKKDLLPEVEDELNKLHVEPQTEFLDI